MKLHTSQLRDSRPTTGKHNCTQLLFKHQVRSNTEASWRILLTTSLTLNRLENWHTVHEYKCLNQSTDSLTGTARNVHMLMILSRLFTLWYHVILTRVIGGHTQRRIPHTQPLPMSPPYPRKEFSSTCNWRNCLSWSKTSCINYMTYLNCTNQAEISAGIFGTLQPLSTVANLNLLPRNMRFIWWWLWTILSYER